MLLLYGPLLVAKLHTRRDEEARSIKRVATASLRTALKYIYIYIYIYIYTCILSLAYIHTYIYIYICVCVCVCVYARAEEREERKGRETSREIYMQPPLYSATCHVQGNSVPGSPGEGHGVAIST